MRVPYCSSGAVIFASLLLAACGSGSPSYSSGTSPVPAPVTAPVLPTSAAFTTVSVVSPPASAGATSLTLQLPPSPGYSGQAIFPVASVPPNLRMTVTYSNKPPAGLSAFAIARKPASAQRGAFDELSTDVVYACFAANYLVNVDGGPQFAFTLPPGFATSGVVYNLALAQNGAWTDGYGGPGTVVSGANSATVSVTGRFGFVIPANGLVCAALFGRSTSAPAPVPATPPPSSTQTPLGVTAAPTAISNGGVALTVGATDTLTVAAGDAPATATTTCGTGSVATLTGSPGATLVLTGTAVGTCAVTLTNAAGKTDTITVTIAAAPTLAVTAAPTAVVGSGLTLTVGAIETLSIASADAPATATTTCGTGSIATLSGSPGATFVLTGTAAGTCTVTLTNAAGKFNTINVTIAAQPTLGVTAAPTGISGGGVTLGLGATDTLSIAAGDAPATATTTCGTGSIATLSGSPGATFVLTGTAVGTCSITLTNAAGKTDTINVTITAQPILSPAPLVFTSTGVSLTLTATESGYTGALTESNTCSGIATVSPSNGTGPTATFTVTSVAAGPCTITITDSAGRSGTGSVSVTTLGVTVNSKSRKL